MTAPSIDIFCHVMDNYGDLGVTWRLARQLATEKNCIVRLITDNMNILQKFIPQLDGRQNSQHFSGVTILLWDSHLPDFYKESADCVIEAFACSLPEFVADAMRSRAVHPVWIDLEYLSAENWVEECHARPSMHPSTGLMKSLFFPGFAEQTGGLTREAELLQQKKQFQSSDALQNAWRIGKNLPILNENTIDISMFCYNSAPLGKLFSILEGSSYRVFAPTEIAALLLQQFDDKVVAFPFMSQDDYDRLLWTCDVNFVRGEDSFVRALWAGRPYIWQIYRQQDGAHYPKLDAFLRTYSLNMEPDIVQPLAEMTRMWNLGDHSENAIAGFFDQLPALTDFSQDRVAQLARQDDLATQLIRFIEAQRHAY